MDSNNDGRVRVFSSKLEKLQFELHEAKAVDGKLKKKSAAKRKSARAARKINRKR